MASATVRLRGLDDLQRAFSKMSPGDLRKELNRELIEVGKIVAEDARSRFAGISASSAAGFRPRTRGFGSAVVEQRRRRTTGQHPQFGALQMRRALLPALFSKEGEVVKGLEDMLDRLGSSNGF